MSGKSSAALSGAASGAAMGTQILPGWGTAIGAVVGGVAGLLSSPKAAPVADYKPIDLAEEQKKAIGANLANFDAATLLSSKANNYEQAESARLMELAMPGFSALRQRLLATANSDLDSQTTLPQDVQDQIARYAAEKNVTRGTSGQFNGFSLVKDFGFNLLDWQQASRARAMNTLSTVYNLTPRVNVMSPLASMVTPDTALKVAQGNSETQYNIDQAALNSQTAATNQRRSELAGVLQSVGTLGGMAYDNYRMQPKVEKDPAPTPPAPYPKVTDQGFAKLYVSPGLS